MSKYDIFISYRRNGGEYTARILRDKLEEMGYRVFFDVESLRSGDFNTKLYSVINECKDFLLILSPGALDRCQNQDDWVRSEIEHALQKNKNIVPVMLRGFSFPETLPESINPVRYKNGLEASSQFFDAFVEKLQGFLTTKPPLVRRITQDSLFKRTLPVLIALVVIAAVGTGAYFAVRTVRNTFPKTAVEKNVTSEVIYYVESHLTLVNQAAAAADRAMKAVERYLAGGSTEKAAMDRDVDVSVRILTECLPERYAPEDGFLGRVGALDGAPFSTAELKAMHDVVIQFCQNWIGHLRYLQWVVMPETPLGYASRMTILDSHRTLLEEDLKAHAYNVNQLLLPITDSSFLKDFFNSYLPDLTWIPLSATTWSSDYDALTAEVNACVKKEEAALDAMAIEVGNTTVKNAELRETLIQDYMALGLSLDEAERITEYFLESEDVPNQAVETPPVEKDAAETIDPDQIAGFLPAEGDNEQVLWEKMARLVEMKQYKAAETCVDALESLVRENDPNAAEYIPALRRFFQQAVPEGIDYGVMVTAQGDENNPNEVYRIGDIIVMAEGKICRTYDEYAALRSAMPEGPYTVTVLRVGADGALGVVDLKLDSGMPKMYMQTLSTVGYFD